MPTAKYAVKGVYGLTIAFIKITINVDLKISLLSFENKAIREINKTAAALMNNPRNGMASAWSIPPKADSLNAQSAVILIADI